MATKYDIEPTTQHTPFKELNRFMPIQSKTVMEIGGNSDCVSALPFINAGASSVTVSGLDHINSADPAPHENIKLVTANALQLRNIFGDSTFDIVYGVSILEHIPNPNLLLEQVFHVLKPGGMAYLQGSPVWSGAYGHHIWLDWWRHGTKKNYHFMPWPGAESTNPIPDWGHLLYKPEELTDILRENGVLEEDIPHIIDFIYTGDVTNKENASSIMQAASNAALVIQSVDIARYVLPSETLQRLRNIYPEQNEDWSITGIGLALLKPKTK